jgi:hypothetical protein
LEGTAELARSRHAQDSGNGKRASARSVELAVQLSRDATIIRLVDRERAFNASEETASESGDRSALDRAFDLSIGSGEIEDADFADRKSGEVFRSGGHRDADVRQAFVDFSGPLDGRAIADLQVIGASGDASERNGDALTGTAVDQAASVRVSGEILDDRSASLEVASSDVSDRRFSGLIAGFLFLARFRSIGIFVNRAIFKA